MQISAFVGAWRSLQGLCQAPDILPDAMLVRSRVADRAEWGHELGLPRFALLRVPVLLPHWTRLGQWLREGRDQILALGGCGLTSDCEVWRRWTPGLPHSQECASNGTLPDVPLTALAPAQKRRIHVKTNVPQWQQQGLAFHRWRKQWAVPLELHNTYEVLGRRSVLAWIESHGLLTRDDLIGMVGRWGCVARHAERLEET